MNRRHWIQPALISFIVVVATLTLNGPSDATTMVRPTIPLFVHAVAHNAAATVMWSRPASNGGSPITHYVVFSHPFASICTTTTTSCTVARLANGTRYTFSVVARNKVGVSQPSAFSNHVIPDVRAPRFSVANFYDPSFNAPSALTSNGTNVWVANSHGGTNGLGSVSQINVTSGLVTSFNDPSFNAPSALTSNGPNVWVANVAEYGWASSIQWASSSLIARPILLPPKNPQNK